MKKAAPKKGLSAKDKKDNFIKDLNEKVDQLIQEHSDSFENDKQTLEWEMGIDEAGRGPVLGPLVYGCCVWPIKLRKLLGDLGFADSKQLNEDQRDYFFDVMQKMQDKLLHYEVKVISAEEISNKMLGVNNYKNLNQISFDSAYHLINSLAGTKKFNVTELYVDTVGSASTYQNKLNQDFNQIFPNMKFTVAEKADSKFAIVSAASIGAKVTRDYEMKNFQFKQKVEDIIDEKILNNCGSGYPADPNTKKWLDKVFDNVFAYPNIVRYSWGTIVKKMEAEKLMVNFYDSDVEQGQQQLQFNTNKQPYLIKSLNTNYDFEI